MKLPAIRAEPPRTFFAFLSRHPTVSWDQRLVFRDRWSFLFWRSVPPQFRFSFCSGYCIFRYSNGLDRWWPSRGPFSRSLACWWGCRRCGPRPQLFLSCFISRFRTISAFWRLQWPVWSLFIMCFAYIFKTLGTIFLFLFRCCPVLFWSAPPVSYFCWLGRLHLCTCWWWCWPALGGVGTSRMVESSSCS